jgi:LCP family protein required for cell wall assembly
MNFPKIRGIFKKSKWWWASVPLILILLATIAVFAISPFKPTQTAAVLTKLLSPVKKEQAPLADTVSTAGAITISANSIPYALTNGQSLATPLVSGNTRNILLIGPDISGNYDTMMIVSLNTVTRDIRYFSLPRDIYVDYSEQIKDELIKVWPKYAENTPIFKINAAHYLGKRINYRFGNGRFGNPEFDFMTDLLQEMFGIQIDDYIVAKPLSFRKIVDYFGGVDMEVPYRMDYFDPTQDLRIDLQKGFQHLDGFNAEGFFRFREGYNEQGKFINHGDIERKKHQTDFFQAFATQKLTLINAGKMAGMVHDIMQYIDTSITSSDAIADYIRLVADFATNGYTQSSGEIECTDFMANSIYFLDLVTRNVSDKSILKEGKPIIIRKDSTTSSAIGVDTAATTGSAIQGQAPVISNPDSGNATPAPSNNDPTDNAPANNDLSNNSENTSPLEPTSAPQTTTGSISAP